MESVSRTPNQRLLDVRRRATFGRAVRPQMAAATPVDQAAPERVTDELPAITPSSGDGVEGSRRRSPRVAVADEVGIRRIGSFNFQARLHDVSSGGCKVELIEQYEMSDQLVARLPKLEPLGARVRWSMGTTAGVEFLTTMHPAVFDSLLMRLSSPRSGGNDQ